MLERDSTTAIFHTLVRDNANLPRQQFRTSVHTLDEAMFNLKNILPTFEASLIQLILAETNESLLIEGIKHCQHRISEEIDAHAQEKAHHFVSMWKNHLRNPDTREAIPLGQPNDSSHYQRFKRAFNAGDQLDSLLRVYNAYFERLAKLQLLAVNKPKAKPPLKRKPLRIGF